MTSPASAKQDSYIDATLQTDMSPRAPFNFMGLYTEIRLMIYKEAFSESHITKYPRGLENAMNEPKDPKTMSNFDDSNELDDCDKPPDRLRLKGKLGLPLSCKAIWTEALPVLYETHHFKLTVWEESQNDLEARKQAETSFTYRYYLRRRNPTLVEHMTHMEIKFDVNFDHSDKLYAGAHIWTISLLQDVAAACPKLETFRFLTAIFPQGWILDDDDPRSNLRRDTATTCFRTFTERGCNLDFQVSTDSLTMVDFLDEIAPFDAQSRTWTLTDSGDFLYQWKSTDRESMRVRSLGYRRSEGLIQGASRKD